MRSAHHRPSILVRAVRIALIALPVVALLASAEEPGEGTADSGVDVRLGERGLDVQSRDGLFRFRLGGRVHADGTLHVGDTPGPVPGPPEIDRGPSNGTEIRRARFVSRATVYDDWIWMGEVDFANNDVKVTDFVLGYTGVEGLDLRAGHQKQPFSLQLEMSSNDLPFTERSIDNAITVALVDRAIGGRAELHGDHWFVAAGIYGDSVDPQDRGGDEGWGAAARAIWAPVRSDRALVHLGLRGAFRQPEASDESVRFRDETTNMSNYRVVDTGALEGVDLAVLYGPEAAVAFGPFSLYGEYTRTMLQRDGLRTVEFEGGHVAATWSLTGESRAATYAMKTGEFKRLVPRRPFGLRSRGPGAWELAARYAYVNLNDGGPGNPVPGNTVAGGREQAFTLALNWYPNYNVRLMLDWRRVLQSDVATGDAQDVEVTKEAEGLDVFTFRTQFAF